VPLLVASGFLLFFFRDPERVHNASHSAVLSPADGRVLVAGLPTGEATPPGQWHQISVFLSPMDVHVNRIPVSGRVRRVEYHPGRFLPAYRKESGDLNERSEITIDHDGQHIVVRQIVGVLARRVVCRTREGLDVKAGERYGVMKFGSRMDVFVPIDATLHVRVGDTVVGGVTVIATLSTSRKVEARSGLETHRAR
jgi:phosphatidylserine decarboxylase